MDPQIAQSQPTARPLSRAASHTDEDEDESKYSLNLDALPRSNDDASSDIHEEPLDIIDVVGTDDIDGPTDFTQNMEYWMSLKLPNVVEPTPLQGQEKLDLEQYISSDEPLSSSSELTQTPTRNPQDIPSLPDTNDIRGTIERQHADAQLPYPHHQKSSAVISNLDGPYDNEPIQSEPTSPVAGLRRRLQPSVEDYEDSPSHARGERSLSSSAISDSLRRRPGHPHLRTSSTPQLQRQAVVESQTIISLENTLRTLRQELDGVKAKAQTDVEEMREDHAAELANQDSRAISLKEELRQERARSMKQAQHNAALALQNASLAKDFRDSSNDLEDLRNKMISIHQTVQEQLQIGDEEHSTIMRKLKEGHQREVSELKEQVKLSTGQELSARTSELQEALAENRQEISGRDQQIDQLQKQLADRENSLHLAEQRAEEAEIILEETAQLHREEMTHEQQLHDMQISALEERGDSLNKALNQARTEIETLKQKLQTAERSSSQYCQDLMQVEEMHEELKERAAGLEDQNNLVKSKLARLEGALKQAEAKVASRVAEYAADLERLKADHDKEKEQMHGQAEVAVLKVKDLVDKERKEVKRLREELSGAATSTSCEHEELEDLRNEMRITNDRIEDVERERDAMRAEFRECKKALQAATERAQHAESEREDATSELYAMQEDYRVVNEKVNQKLLEAVQAKEEQWKLKLVEMERDRQRRGKLLLLQWGKDEVGPSNPQGYKYKYLIKEAMGI